jgi:hypothetical protein
MIVKSRIGIESGLYYRRDVALREDRGRVRTGITGCAVADDPQSSLGSACAVGPPERTESATPFCRPLERGRELGPGCSTWFVTGRTKFSSAPLTDHPNKSKVMQSDDQYHNKRRLE